MAATIEEVTPLAETLEDAEQSAQTEQEAKPDAEQTTDVETTGVEQTTAHETNDHESGDVIVAIGDEKPEGHEKAPPWVRELRQKNRELARRNRELEALASGRQSLALGKKPQLEDFDYDESKFSDALAEYVRRESAIKAREEQETQEVQRQQAAFQARLQSYEAGKSALKAPNFESAEDLVKESLNEKQQAILIKCSKNPSLLVLALGSNPKRLKELAALTDLADFTYELASTEGQLKVQKRSTIPEPEKRVQGATGAVAAAENTLDKLRAEAERTGDYSKVMAHKRAKKAA